eukprot:gene554-947_t
MFALWIVRRKRSFSICQSDAELKDIFTFIFQGGYTPRGYETVVQKVLQLSAEAKVRVKDELESWYKEVILPSIAGGTPFHL